MVEDHERKFPAVEASVAQPTPTKAVATPAQTKEAYTPGPIDRIRGAVDDARSMKRKVHAVLHLIEDASDAYFDFRNEWDGKATEVKAE